MWNSAGGHNGSNSTLSWVHLLTTGHLSHMQNAHTCTTYFAYPRDPISLSIAAAILVGPQPLWVGADEKP
jgi:hypothetical protein